MPWAARCAMLRRPVVCRSVTCCWQRVVHLMRVWRSPLRQRLGQSWDELSVVLASRVTVHRWGKEMHGGYRPVTAGGRGHGAVPVFPYRLGWCAMAAAGREQPGAGTFRAWARGSRLGDARGGRAANGGRRGPIGVRAVGIRPVVVAAVGGRCAVGAFGTRLCAQDRCLPCRPEIHTSSRRGICRCLSDDLPARPSRQADDRDQLTSR
jgi:hypothetical protein